MGHPLVSAVVPTYRDPKRVLDAVQSIQKQDMDDWEAIIIDDGSSSQDQAIIHAALREIDDPRFRFVCSQRNRGPARTRNLGVRLARGRYIAFLDADDLWKPEKLRLQIQQMQAAGVGLSCTSYENLSMTTGACNVRTPPAKIIHAQLLRQNTMGCSTVMLDRQIVGRSYFPDIRMRQDFAHWLKILRPGGVALGLPQPLTQRRVFAGSLSSNKLRAAWYTWRMYRDIEGLGLLRAGRYFGAYAFGGAFRS